MLKSILGAGLALASAVTFAQAPGTGITGTRHDWATDSTGAPKTSTVLLWQKSATDTTSTTSSTSGIPWIDPATTQQGTQTINLGLCSRCHTPHQAKSTNLLWNHTLTTNTFTWDQPSTTGGTTYPSFKGDTYKGPTTKCLSCHDGTMASTDGMWFGKQFLKGSKHTSTGFSSKNVASSTGGMSGNHPVAMPYPYGGASNTYNGTFNGNAMTLTEFVSDPTTNGIRLFNDAANNGVITAGPLAGKSGIECTSCHDVHNGAQTKDAYLLRGMVAGGKAQGYLCTKCHNK